MLLRATGPVDMKTAEDSLGISSEEYNEIVDECIFGEDKKDGDDEKIRKEIIDFLMLPHPQFVGKRHYEEWIAWLEKQGKQKPLTTREKLQALSDGKQHLGWIDDADKVIAEENECSKEDENMRYKAIAILNKLCASNKDFVFAHSTLVEVFDWLKSLKPQPKWELSYENNVSTELSPKRYG